MYEAMYSSIEQLTRAIDKVAWEKESLLEKFVEGNVFSRKRTVPDLLKAIAKKGSSELLAELHGQLIDQGDRSENAVLAVPFLGGLLPSLPTCLQPQLIEMLVAIGVGWEDECLGPRGVRGCSIFDLAAYQAVSQEAFSVLQLLPDLSADVRMNSYRFMAWFPIDSPELFVLLSEASESENLDEAVVAMVTRSLLGDLVEPDFGVYRRRRFASNAAFAYMNSIGEKNLEVFIEMSEHTFNLPNVGDFECNPFGFNLGEFAAEALHRQSPQILSEFLSHASEGPLKTYISTEQTWR